MKQIIQALLLASVMLILTSCSGGGSSGPSASGLGSDTSSDTSNTNDSSSSSTDSSTVVHRLGSFNAGTGAFSEGVIAAADTTLAASESSSLSVSIVDQNNNLFNEDFTEVIFTSPCIASGLSEVDPAIALNTTGTVNVTYTAIGCDGDDIVRAQTTVDGITLSANVTITATPAPLGSITFDSTSLNVIGIKGSGGAPETATVTFKVTNAAGGPAPNQVVDFTLNNTLGGISLSNAQGTTNAEGLASTTVNAGEVATTVVVTATATRDGVTTSARSRGLAITTGIPDQNSFSLSATTLNIEGGEFDGITTELNIRLADRYNNPVADGTAVNFTTEGGSIEGSCITENGLCSVTLTSQDPRPSDGRVTVRATALGEESFADVDPTNGLFDDTDVLFSIPEAFLDIDGDGFYDQGLEPFVDLNNNGAHDAADGLFDGLLCNGPGLCGNDTATVFENIEIIFSLSKDLLISLSTTPLIIGSDDVEFSVFVVDSNGQKPAAGTEIVVSSSLIDKNVGNVGTKIAADDNSAGAAKFDFVHEGGNPAKKGKITVTVTTPLGIITTTNFDAEQI